MAIEVTLRGYDLVANNIADIISVVLKTVYGSDIEVNFNIDKGYKRKSVRIYLPKGTEIKELMSKLERPALPNIKIRYRDS